MGNERPLAEALHQWTSGPVPHAISLRGDARRRQSPSAAQRGIHGAKAPLGNCPIRL